MTRFGLVPVLVLALFAGGCVHELPPPATPAAVAPDLASVQPQPAGEGRVIVDVVDGPTPVRTVHTSTVVLNLGDTDDIFDATSWSTSPLCTTPCVADMPPGQYTLAFPVRGSTRRLQLGQVDVSTTPTVYRRALGRYERAGAGLVLGILAVTFGGASFATGAALLPVGAANGDGGMGLAGGITLGAGVVLTALGIYGITASPALQERGSSIQFALPSSTQAPAASNDANANGAASTNSDANANGAANANGTANTNGAPNPNAAPAPNAPVISPP